MKFNWKKFIALTLFACVIIVFIVGIIFGVIWLISVFPKLFAWVMGALIILLASLLVYPACMEHDGEYVGHDKDDD